LNQTFWHQTVTSAQIQDYITAHAGRNLHDVFQQYLTTKKIPVLEYKISKGRLSYRWSNVVPGFAMPVKAGFGWTYGWMSPTTSWKTMPHAASDSHVLAVDPNFLVTAKDVGSTP